MWMFDDWRDFVAVVSTSLGGLGVVLGLLLLAFPHHVYGFARLGTGIASSAGIGAVLIYFAAGLLVLPSAVGLGVAECVRLYRQHGSAPPLGELRPVGALLGGIAVLVTRDFVASGFLLNTRNVFIYGHEPEAALILWPLRVLSAGCYAAILWGTYELVVPRIRDRTNTGVRFEV